MDLGRPKPPELGVFLRKYEVLLALVIFYVRAAAFFEFGWAFLIHL
jgi:hypothetical protein